MLIGNIWKVDSDGLNVILRRKSTRKTDNAVVNPGGESEVGWTIEGYYSSFPNALKSMVDHRIKDTHLVDLRVITAEIRVIKEDIEALSGRLEEVGRTDKHQKLTQDACDGVEG